MCDPYSGHGKYLFIVMLLLEYFHPKEIPIPTPIKVSATDSSAFLWEVLKVVLVNWVGVMTCLEQRQDPISYLRATAGHGNPLTPLWLCQHLSPLELLLNPGL